MHFLLEALQVGTRRPSRSARSSTSRRGGKKQVPVDYKGFTIDDRFVIGYGLDLEGRYRNLDYIAALNSKVQSALRVKAAESQRLKANEVELPRGA